MLSRMASVYESALRRSRREGGMRTPRRYLQQLQGLTSVSYTISPLRQVRLRSRSVSIARRRASMDARRRAARARRLSAWASSETGLRPFADSAILSLSGNHLNPSFFNQGGWSRPAVIHCPLIYHVPIDFLEVAPAAIESASDGVFRYVVASLGHSLTYSLYG